jgi:RNA recognition motif-containing protein
MMNIFVSNLSFNIQDEDLRKRFAQYGNVASAKVVVDRVTNRSRGFGFVTMDDTGEAENAIRELNGVVLDDRSIKVNEARHKDK